MGWRKRGTVEWSDMIDFEERGGGEYVRDVADEAVEHQTVLEKLSRKERTRGQLEMRFVR